MKNLIRKIEKYFNQELDFSNISSTTIDGNENLLSGAITYLMHKNIDSEVSLSLLQNIIDNGVNVNHKIEESNSPLIKVFFINGRTASLKQRSLKYFYQVEQTRTYPVTTFLNMQRRKNVSSYWLMVQIWKESLIIAHRRLSLIAIVSISCLY